MTRYNTVSAASGLSGCRFKDHFGFAAFDVARDSSFFGALRCESLVNPVFSA
jgi:hypothetical protein